MLSSVKEIYGKKISRFYEFRLTRIDNQTGNTNCPRTELIRRTLNKIPIMLESTLGHNRIPVLVLWRVKDANYRQFTKIQISSEFYMWYETIISNTSIKV